MGDEREGIPEGAKLAKRILAGSYRPEPADARLDALTLARVVGQLTQEKERLLSIIGEVAGFGSEVYKRAERGGGLG